MPFEMKPVENSSNLQSAGYDPDTQTLRVEFKGGKQYDYHGVPEEMHQSFWSAPKNGSSHGSYFHSIIEPGCRAAKVEEA